MAEDRMSTGVNIPVSATSAGVVNVQAYFPVEMTEEEWAQMHRVLEAMKPALVLPRTEREKTSEAGGNTDGSAA